jgi:hypothetical protein
MTRKLTLSVNAEVVEFAHRLAKENHYSISRLVEDYFRSLQNRAGNLKLAEKTISLYGRLADKPIPDKAALRHYRYAKRDR